MRAWLLACAALALAHAAAHSSPRPHNHPHPHPLPLTHSRTHPAHPRLDPARLDHIKTQILAKLGLSARPRPQGAPPRDVVRQILARAADPPPPAQHTEHTDPAAMREIIAIAHRGAPRMQDQVAARCHTQLGWRDTRLMKTLPYQVYQYDVSVCSLVSEQRIVSEAGPDPFQFKATYCCVSPLWWLSVDSSPSHQLSEGRHDFLP